MHIHQYQTLNQFKNKALFEATFTGRLHAMRGISPIGVHAFALNRAIFISKETI